MAPTYTDAGVDIAAGEALVEKIKSRVSQTYGPQVVNGVGGFAALYQVDDTRLLAAATDGVGTKVMVAQRLGIHHTIGIDLVAMCVNDVLCTGARGLFFMDYLATGKLDVAVAEQIVAGITAGCLEAKVALIGGETAEMPGMYPDGVYDLAGFAVGEVRRSQIMDGSQIQAGDSIVGIASSGIHANGLSLARMLGRDDDESYWQQLLKPTRIYTSEIERLRYEKVPIHGLTHITGGGLLNLARLNQQCDYIVEHFPSLYEVSPIFRTLSERSLLSDVELFRTFNMGVGMCVITPTPERVKETLSGLGTKSWTIGRLIKGTGCVWLNGARL